jgi:hypothetical protein
MGVMKRIWRCALRSFDGFQVISPVTPHKRAVL